MTTRCAPGVSAVGVFRALQPNVYLDLNGLLSEGVKGNVRQIWEFDVRDIHEALLLTWFNSTPSMDNQSAAS